MGTRLVVGLAFLLLSTIGCSSDNRNKHEAKYSVESIKYVKDVRTGLCFAYCTVTGDLTCVPCDSLLKSEQVKNITVLESQSRP